MASLWSTSSSSSLIRRSESGRPCWPTAAVHDWPDPTGPDPGADHKLKRELAPGGAEPESTLSLPIQAGETLHTISLKYNIPVAELKRVNNLFQDNEFFALQSLKLPLKSAHSVRTELMPTGAIPTASTASPTSHVPGWLVDHWSSPTGGSLASPGLSSPVLSDESEWDGPLIAVGVHGAGGASGRAWSESRPAQKAKRFLRAKDKDLAQLKAQHERLHRPDATWPLPSDSELDDLALDRTDTPSAYYHSVPRSVCWVGLSLIVVAVIVILYFARYEFNLIQHELPSEESLRHLQAEDIKSQASA
ncbi:hypothetical protein TCAL_16102 [Tigriopus californicus]|uniref:LysM domain-containing protein n=1 Tax=Tigriopus californicus TaxID=6832 RepID=A0A553PNC0_TIGCA|nr:hypothetical protein TCAL_16102 [Tigriopus californicus]